MWAITSIALSRKPIAIGHMYIHTFLLRMTDTISSKKILTFLPGRPVDWTVPKLRFQFGMICKAIYNLHDTYDDHSTVFIRGVGLIKG
jgi:hypothetical protein